MLIELLELLSGQLRSLFFDVITSHQRGYCAAVVGAKGDLKWYTKVAFLDRSFEHQGRIRDIACCHECRAGTPNAGWPWEDLSENPSWAPTRWQQRPWSRRPPMSSVPFTTTLAEERQYKRDIFHITKLGIYRDLTGSCICFLARRGFFGGDGDFAQKLNSAHGAFLLYCKASCKTPALRYFSRAFMNYMNFASYPWCNAKGSDTMLLLSWLIVQITGFENDPNNANAPELPLLSLMKATCRAALATFKVANNHGLWLERDCGMILYAEMTKFINGYNALANLCLNEDFNGFGIKPKIHLLRHLALEIHELLLDGAEFIPNVKPIRI